MPEVGSTSGFHKVESHAKKHALKYSAGAVLTLVVAIKPLSAPIASILGYVTKDEMATQLKWRTDMITNMRQELDAYKITVEVQAGTIRTLQRDTERHEQDIRELRR